MIKNLKISNFRCFKSFDIQGFERVNLFGGKNNSGKTALLEGLYLGSTPSYKTIMRLRDNRGESLEFLKAIPEKAWNNLFFDKKEIGPKSEIILEYDDKINNVEIVCNDSIEQLDEILSKDNGESNTMLTEDEFKKSTLNISAYKNDKRVSGRSFSMTASSIGITVNSIGIIPKTLHISSSGEADFIPAFLRLSNSALAQEFDKCDLQGNVDEVLKIIQIIDGSITQIKTLNIGEPAIYLKRETSKYLPITLFGEAINRVVHFILKIINNNNSILLIDEIENGIHYTNQSDLWEMLFKLSIEFNIQIFATTHSYEMIKSFSEVAHKAKENIGTYFEIARDIRTDQIVGIKREIETLKYELSQKMELRGE